MHAKCGGPATIGRFNVAVVDWLAKWRLDASWKHDSITPRLLGNDSYLEEDRKHARTGKPALADGSGPRRRWVRFTPDAIAHQ